MSSRAVATNEKPALLATAALLAGQPDSDRAGESTMMSLRRFSRFRMNLKVR